MKVLFTSTAGIGHVQPMIPLAVAARDRGDDVLFATGADSCGMVEAAGIVAIAAGLSAADRMREYRRRFPEGAQLSGMSLPDHMFPRLFGAVAALPMYAELIDPATAWEPDVMVCDAAEFAGPVIANVLGIPNATHSFGATIPDHRVSAAASFLDRTWAANGLEPRPFGGCYDHLYIDIYPRSMQVGDVTRLGRTTMRRPESADHVPGHEASPTCTLFLDGAPKDRPIVYITFGTVFNDNDDFRTLARVPTTFDATFVATVGPRGDPELFGVPASNLHVERYIPQHVILDRCAAVISHGGSGTMLAALSQGIPQVCVPQAADQFANAGACAAAGAGIALSTDVSVQTVSDALARVLGDDQYRDAARTVAREIEAMPGAGAVMDELASL